MRYHVDENQLVQMHISEMMEQYMFMVPVALKRFQCRCASSASRVWDDDLASAGAEGLWHAAIKYDPGNAAGASFATYGRYRVEGAIMDEYRKLVSKRRTDYSSDLSLDDMTTQEDPYTPESMIDRDSPDLRYGDDDIAMLDAIDDIFSHLSSSNEELARWYYQEGLTLRQCGVRLGRTESRMSQRITRINVQIRSAARKAGVGSRHVS